MSTERTPEQIASHFMKQLTVHALITAPAPIAQDLTTYFKWARRGRITGSDALEAVMLTAIYNAGAPGSDYDRKRRKHYTYKAVNFRSQSCPAIPFARLMEVSIDETTDRPLSECAECGNAGYHDEECSRYGKSEPIALEPVPPVTKREGVTL
jgi:hypothetical protein